MRDRYTYPSMIAVLAVVGAVPLLAHCGGGGGDGGGASPSVQVVSLSSPENLSTGDDSLVRVTAHGGGVLPSFVVTQNGADVTAGFQRSADDRSATALLTGLPVGSNTVTVQDAADRSRTLGTLTLQTYPLQGPVLYAPQEYPMSCMTQLFTVYPGGPRLSDAPSTSPDCTVPTRVDWVYHDASRAGTAVWQRYDPASPPTAVETTTLSDGRQVPYIVRLETGVINRGIYQIAMVADPAADAAPTPFRPPSRWNGKLVYPFGQSCGAGWYVQGTAMGPVGGSSNSANGSSGDNNALNDLPLSKGFAVANSTLNYFGQNCNHIISAETMMMVKERVVKGYGPVRYTMGWGSSGSAMQQSMIADAYPGLLDGIVLLNGFPDNTSPASVEGRLFYNYQLNHSKGGTTENASYASIPNTPYDPTYDNATAARRAADASLVAWTNGELAAASGYSTYHSIRQQASFWAGRTDSVQRLANAGDRDNVMAGAGNASVFNAIIANSSKYSPASAVTSAPLGILPAPPVSALAPNSTGLRPNVADHNKNVLGVDANGFGRSYTANVGVQYGLNALNSGQITMAQFIDLNRKIGGVDIDGNFTSARIPADEVGLRNAYRSGMIMYGGAGLSQTAILNLDGLNNEATGAGDLHLKFFHFQIRARLAAASGGFANHVMWNGQADAPAYAYDPHAHPNLPVVPPRAARTGRRVIVMQQAFNAMDRWLNAVTADASAQPRAAKVLNNKPVDLVDGCFGASTPGSPDDFIAEPQRFGGYDSVFRRGNASSSPAGLLDIGPVPATCNAMYPASSYPRFDAGEPITGRTMQCSLKPIDVSDYAGHAALNPGWTGAQRANDLAAIAQAFPVGVCDYTRPGLQEQPLAGTWIQVTGPGQMRALRPLSYAR